MTTFIQYPPKSELKELIKKYKAASIRERSAIARAELGKVCRQKELNLIRTFNQRCHQPAPQKIAA